MFFSSFVITLIIYAVPDGPSHAQISVQDSMFSFTIWKVGMNSLPLP